MTTAEPYRDSDKMPFGKFKGMPIGDVPADYLDWCYGQDWMKGAWPRLWAYIKKNKGLLDKELEESNDGDENPF